MENPDNTHTAPAEIEWGADESTLESLSRLVGQSLRTGLCSSLRAHLVERKPPRLRTEKIALPVPGGLVTVAFPDWADTEHFAMNAFRIEARYLEKPPEWAGGQYSEKKNGPIFPWTGISFREPEFYKSPPSAPVERIVVYRYKREEHNRERGFTERVSFDKAVLFEQAGDQQLLLFVDDASIAGLLGISGDSDEIREVLEGCKVSQTLSENRTTNESRATK